MRTVLIVKTGACALKLIKGKSRRMRTGTYIKQKTGSCALKLIKVKSRRMRTDTYIK